MENKTLIEFAQNQILSGLQQLPNEWIHRFKQMYSHRNLEKSIEKIVRDMPNEKLDWALSQVERSVEKLKSQTKK
jgi:hypothetical protein